VRALGVLVLVLALLALAAGCGGLGGDDDGESASPPAQTTSASVRTAVFERAYSECATYPMVRLATKYGVDPKVDPVSRAVARFWTRQFNGGKDTIPTGVRACIQGFNDPVGNPA
jgi:hypothetical protein